MKESRRFSKIKEIRLTHRTKDRWAMVLFSLFFSFFTYGQKIHSSVEPSEIKIGEEIIYTIEVETDSIRPVIFPETKSMGPLEVIESYETDTISETNRYLWIKKYGLTQFDEGEYTIPKQQIQIGNQTFFTDTLRVEVHEVVVDTLQQKMFDIKPGIAVQSPSRDWKKILFWLIPLLVIGGLILFLIKRKRRKEEAEKKLPPYEEAIVALQKLDNSEYLKQNKSKEYYSSLTEIVKRYLDREVDEAALESTTDELISRLILLKQSGKFDFDMQMIRDLEQIFKRADLIKFARKSGTSGEAEGDRRTIEEIINKTHEAIPEPTEEELLENQEYLESLKKKKQQRKWVYAISGFVLLLMVSGLVYGGLTGFDNLKDKILGNPLKELAEGRWIKSEYGYPSIILETPEVLERSSGTETNREVFTYGEMKSPLFISVSISSLNEEQPDLNQQLNLALNRLENEGAKNLLVMRDYFEGEKGVTGVRAFGEFNLLVSQNRVLKNTSYYELILFSQQDKLQELLIVFQDKNKYSEEIISRIIASIELELSRKR